MCIKKKWVVTLQKYADTQPAVIASTDYDRWLRISSFSPEDTKKQLGVCMFACIHVCMFLCIHMCTCVCVYVCMYVSKCVRMGVKVYMHVSRASG